MTTTEQSSLDRGRWPGGVENFPYQIATWFAQLESPGELPRQQLKEANAHGKDVAAMVDFCFHAFPDLRSHLYTRSASGHAR